MSKNKKTITKIGIIGYGTVGKAVDNFYRACNECPYVDAISGKPAYDNEKYEIQIFDPAYPEYKKFVANDCDVIFICVPTPYSKDGTGYDLKAIRNCLKTLSTGGYKDSIICLKCTVLPGTTRALSEEFGVDLYFNPEFLTDKTAIEDFAKPEVQIIGIAVDEDKKSTKNAQRLLNLLPLPNNFDTDSQYIVSLEEAECIKMMRNNFYATKVIFANQFYDYVQSLPHGPSYEIIRKIFENDSMVGKNHWNVWHNNKRGYAGKCLIKDSKALLTQAKKFTLLQEVDKINDSLLRSQNIKAPELD